MGHDNPARVTQWKVLTGSGFEDQAGATCVEFVPPVVISGATGPNAASVNGVFEPTGEIYNGKVLFAKRGDADKWLRFVAGHSFWIVSSTKPFALCVTGPYCRPFVSCGAAAAMFDICRGICPVLLPYSCRYKST